MTDETPMNRPRRRQHEEIEDAVVVDGASETAERDAVASPAASPAEPVASPAEPVADGSASPAEPVADTTASPAEPTTVVQPAEPTTVMAAPAEPAPRIVYVEAPVPPRPLGNRGVGVLYALLGTVVFAAVLAIATYLIQVFATGLTSVTFLASLEFYVPVIVFLIAFVVLALIANRAAWWAYILGSLIVGLVVYFGTAGLGLLITGLLQNTPAEAAERWNAALVMPFVIIAAVLAREVAMWMGVAIARRGRKVRARNVQRREEWQRELDERRAERERAAYPASPTA